MLFISSFSRALFLASIFRSCLPLWHVTADRWSTIFELVFFCFLFLSPLVFVQCPASFRLFFLCFLNLLTMIIIIIIITNTKASGEYLCEKRERVLLLLLLLVRINSKLKYIYMRREREECEQRTNALLVTWESCRYKRNGFIVGLMNLYGFSRLLFFLNVYLHLPWRKNSTLIEGNRLNQLFTYPHRRFDGR